MSQRDIHQFLRACQAPARLELYATGPHGGLAGQVIAEQPFALLGANPTSDLHLDDPRVSQRHAYVQMIGGRLFCVDLGSRGRLRLRGVACTSGWLDPGHVLEVGPYAIRLSGSAPAAPQLSGFDPLEARGTDPRLLPAVTLEFAANSARLQRWRLNRVLTLVGRATACKLRMADPTVSRFHCALLGTPRGLWVTDLLGREGTWVNEEPVRWARLDDGDRLRVGQFQMRVWHEATPVTAPATLAASPPTATLAEDAASSDSPLAPLLNQFQALQRQSDDEFHETMLLVTRMFSTLHQERLLPVHAELDHIYRLTVELQATDSGVSNLTTSAAAAERVHDAPLRQERQDRWHKVLATVAGAG